MTEQTLNPALSDRANLAVIAPAAAYGIDDRQGHDGHFE